MTKHWIQFNEHGDLNSGDLVVTPTHPGDIFYLRSIEKCAETDEVRFRCGTHPLRESPNRGVDVVTFSYVTPIITLTYKGKTFSIGDPIFFELRGETHIRYVTGFYVNFKAGWVLLKTNTHGSSNFLRSIKATEELLTSKRKEYLKEVEKKFDDLLSEIGKAALKNIGEIDMEARLLLT